MRMCAADDIVSVNGTFVEVTSTQVSVCVFFDCINSNNGIVVLAHHVDDDDYEELSAYHLALNTTNCFVAPAPGHYNVGVFTRNHNNILEVPTMPPTITIDNVLSIPPTPPLCAPGKCYFNEDSWIM